MKHCCPLCTCDPEIMSARKTKRKSCLPFSHPNKLRKLAKSLKVPFKPKNQR